MVILSNYSYPSGVGIVWSTGLYSYTAAIFVHKPVTLYNQSYLRSKPTYILLHLHGISRTVRNRKGAKIYMSPSGFEFEHTLGTSQKLILDHTIRT